MDDLLSKDNIEFVDNIPPILGKNSKKVIEVISFFNLIPFNKIAKVRLQDKKSWLNYITYFRVFARNYEYNMLIAGRRLTDGTYAIYIQKKDKR